MTEMMGTFMNLIGAMRTLVLAISALTIVISALSVFNTLLAGVIERTNELTVMRAIGASRTQVFALLTAEALALTLVGSLLGIALAYAGGALVETAVRTYIPFAPNEALLSLDHGSIIQTFLVAAAVGVSAAIYPAWRASRLQPANVTRIG
jgi:putative ABC transport system permease protein